MLDLFKEYTQEFYFIGMNDFHEAIEQFVIDKSIDLIVTIPRFHTGITSIFKSSATKKLVFHSSVPVLAAHEKCKKSGFLYSICLHKSNHLLLCRNCTCYVLPLFKNLLFINSPTCCRSQLSISRINRMPFAPARLYPPTF